MASHSIRLITPADNEALKSLIISVVQEFQVTQSEYLLSGESELSHLYAMFSQPKHAYWIIDDHDKTPHVMIGGGGIAPLKGTSIEAGIGELQKLYLLPQYRGKGYGRALLKQIEASARDFQYQWIYLECVEAMARALTLYQAHGYQPLLNRWGDTGHASCTLFMAKRL